MPAERGCARALSWDQRTRWLFLFVAAQFLSPALLFLPGAQAFRPLIRAIPYASSAALLGLTGLRTSPGRPLPGRGYMLAYLVVLTANLLHPATQPVTGLAQLALQVSIVAPVFWADRLIESPARLWILVWMIFLANGVSAVLGVLQVYSPSLFMPPEFTSLGLARDPRLLEALSYRGVGGERIIRPPGLSDMPGGAAHAGAVVGLLGILLAVRPKQSWGRRTFCLVLAGLGMVAIYFTQVRALLLMMLVALLAAMVLFAWLGHVGTSSRLAVAAVLLVCGTFTWAVAVGGDGLAQRFLVVFENGPLASYQKNRGQFLEQTFGELLLEYPLGAGVGRWGMIGVYFGRFDGGSYRPIYVEIQPTGWLLDGGVPLLLCHVAALGLSLSYCYRVSRCSRDAGLSFAAIVVLCFGLMVAGIGLAGPVFNTQGGIQFWLLVAGLAGADRPLASRPGRGVYLEHCHAA